MQRLSLLSSSADPLDVLYGHFNISPPTIPDGPLPDSFDLPVLRNARIPSHLLAVYQTNGHRPGPVLMPIEATLYHQSFHIRLNLSQPPPGSIVPTPHLSPTSPRKLQLTVTVPVVPITVPSIDSLPLLLLFALSLETHPNALAYRLLPRSAVSEFPNASAMASVLARGMTPDAFEDLVKRNFGMWGNMLALGLREGRIEEVVRLCWNVTAEAKRIRAGGVSLNGRE